MLTAELSLLRTMTSKQRITSQLLIEGWSNKDIGQVLNEGKYSEATCTGNHKKWYKTRLSSSRLE